MLYTFPLQVRPGHKGQDLQAWATIGKTPYRDDPE
jgi:hypothetical protein